MYKRYGNAHPEGKLVRAEWTVRKMDLPPEMLTRKRQLLRWVAIALGLITPGDERAGIVDVLDAIFYYVHGKEIEPTPDDSLLFVNKRRKERGERPVVLEAVRYHLRRLEGMGIVEKTKGRGGTYRFTRDLESSARDPAAFVAHIFSQIESTRSLIEKSVRALASLYK
jgi:hypothetical protein